MKVEINFPVIVYRNDGQYGASYSLGLSNKRLDGGFDVGYIHVQFRKGVEVPNRTKIKVKNAFLTFYLSKNTKNATFYIMITDFEIVENAQNNQNIVQNEVKASQNFQSNVQNEIKEDPYYQFGQEIAIADDTPLDLPF